MFDISLTSSFYFFLFWLFFSTLQGAWLLTVQLQSGRNNIFIFNPKWWECCTFLEVFVEKAERYRGELLWRGRSQAETESTRDTITKHQSTTKESVTFTYTDTTALNLCRAYFFFPPNDIFSVFFFCASLNKRHTFMLASCLTCTLMPLFCPCVCTCVRVWIPPRWNK